MGIKELVLIENTLYWWQRGSNKKIYLFRKLLNFLFVIV